MAENGRHIISRFRWDTSFDQKERAVELQNRLSAWSNTNMQKEIMEMFNKVCPPDQTWKIQSIELDLGVIDFNDLENELSKKLCRQLSEKLVDLTLYSNRNSQNIEILNEGASNIDLLSSFLLHGIMPWNYIPTQGTVNQMMTFQLQNNQQKVILMLRQLGVTHQNVRKRIAWQISEPNILKIVEGLEPNNSSLIINFSNELTKIQLKETIIQTGITDFKRNLWLWVLNYLLTERGTLFNKVSFMRSSIQQMADHYNMGYDDLLELIERAIYKVNESSYVKADFILTVQALIKENEASKKKIKIQTEITTDFWFDLECFFKDGTLLKTQSERIEFNELVISLSKEDRSRFCGLVIALGSSEIGLSHTVESLNEASLEAIFYALTPTKSQMMVETIHFLNKISRELNLSIEPKLLWVTGMRFLKNNKNASFDRQVFLKYYLSSLDKTEKILKENLLDKLLTAEISLASKTMSSLEIYTNLNDVLTAELSAKNSSFLKDHFKDLLSNLGKHVSQSTDLEMFTFFKKSLVRYMQLHPHSAMEALMQYPDKTNLRKVLPCVLDDQLITLLIINTKNEKASILLTLQQVLKELKSDKKTGDLAGFTEDHLLSIGMHTLIFYPTTNSSKFVEVIFEKLSELILVTQFEKFSWLLEQILGHKKMIAFGFSTTVLFAINKKITASSRQSGLERANQIMSVSLNKQTDVARLLKTHFADKEFVQLRVLGNIAGKGILNYLLRDGQKLLDSLIIEYTFLLTNELKVVSTKEIGQRLIEIFWKCILNYGDHQGKSDVLQRVFKAAVLYQFPVSNKSRWANLQAKHSENKAHNYLLKSGGQLTLTDLFLLIEECLKNGSNKVINGELTLHLSELITLCFELKPTGLRRILANTSISEKRIGALKSSVTFYQFSLWIASDVSGVINEAMDAIRALHVVVENICSGQVAERMLNGYWEISWLLIKTNNWSAEILQKLVQNTFHQIAQIEGLKIDSVVADLKQKNLRLPKGLRTILVAQVPAFSAIELSPEPDENLMDCDRKGLLENLCFNLLKHKEVPFWLIVLMGF